MSAPKSILYGVNLVLIIAVVLLFSPFLIHPSKLDCVTYKWLPAIRVPCRSSEILKRLVSVFINPSCRCRKLNEILCLCRNFRKGG